MHGVVELDFVKGHMGGNEIVLLDGNAMDNERCVEAALSALDSPGIRGDQAGILEKPTRGGDIKVKIVDRSARDFIPMCGGLTQVLWKALAETDVAKRYHIPKSLKQLVIETDVGLVRVSLKTTRDGTAAFTDMTRFVEECYRLGVSSIEVAGVKSVRVGRVLVADVCEIQRAYPETDFDVMNSEAKEVLIKMQADFDGQRFLDTVNTDFALFSMYLDDPTHGRVLFPHNVKGGHIEPSCGTGSVAIAVALAETSRVGDGTVSVRLDSGGLLVLGGPETTEVLLVKREGKVTEAEFTHSLVEILCTGRIWFRVR
jgi:diaminopimelate epimerase